MGKTVAYWDLYDSKTGQLLEKGKMIESPLNMDPTIGEPVIGAGQWKQAVVERFQTTTPRDGLTTYIVYVSPR